MMRRILLRLLFILGSVQLASAQSTFVQVEARPTLAQAEDRARAYASALPDVVGFSLRSGWYALALGPYTEAEAQRRLANLKAAGIIPSDSYLTDQVRYRQQFWPAGGSAAIVPPQPATVLPNAPTPVVVIDETPREARAAERLLSREERIELQRLLQWFGFYNASLDGAFGPGTRGSMAAWQTANNFEVTGILTTKQRAQLAQSYTEALAAMGLGDLVDRKAGISITMPIELVEFEKYDPPFVHFAPKDNSDIRVLLISQNGDAATLGGLYEIMQTLEIVPLTGTREKKSNSFVLTGQNSEILSHTEAFLDGGLIHGFTLIYPPQKAENMARVINIMRDSYKSLGTALDANDSAGTQSVDLLAGLELRKPTISRSGFYLDDAGRVLTVASAVQSCERVTLDDDYEARVIAQDDRFALLEPNEALVPIGTAQLSTSSARLRADVAVSGYSFGGALTGSTLTYGNVEDVKALDGDASVLRLSVETLEGDIGGPILTTNGAVAGILLPLEKSARALPQDVHYAANTTAISTFLSNHDITPRNAQSDATVDADELVLRASDMTVLVSCW
ncbi:MAG: peptidoglycan-binding protein [Litoreibacter sp.]